MKILIVDDEEKIREVLREYAEFEGYETDFAADGMEAVRKCESGEFDLVLMDIMMPVLDGFSASKKIREKHDIPIIMLSARGEEYDKLFGFEVGADDYVVKPFSPKEVMARIKAVLKRKEVRAGVFRIHGLEIDEAGRNVIVDGVRKSLTPKEYALLFYLVRNRNLAVSREKLLSEIWDYEYYGDDRTIDTHIKMLRKSLGAYGGLIVTLRGLGYKFQADENQEPQG